MELPLAAFLTIFAVVLFPNLAEAFSKEETQESGVQLAKQGMSLILLLSVAMTIPLAWFSQDFVDVMFGWGKMKRRVDRTNRNLGIGGVACTASSRDDFNNTSRV